MCRQRGGKGGEGEREGVRGREREGREGEREREKVRHYTAVQQRPM